MTADLDPTTTAETRRRHPLMVYAGGFLMGSADIVPGVSGGTIALVLGIYEKLIFEVRAGAGMLSRLVRGDLRSGLRDFRAIDWRFLLPLLAGVLTAVLALASLMDHLLDAQPVAMSALFFGLVAGSVVMAARLLKRPRVAVHVPVALVAAAITFVVLGLRSGRITDPSLVVIALAGALAICAMILPGVSGAFLLLLVGMYKTMTGYISDRAIVEVLVFGVGAVLGLALFSTFLNWVLDRHHDVVLAVLIGLMAGSLRVLWPWPSGADGVGDTTLGAPVAGDVPLAVLLGLVGMVVVVGIAALGRRLEAS